MCYVSFFFFFFYSTKPLACVAWRFLSKLKPNPNPNRTAKLCRLPNPLNPPPLPQKCTHYITLPHSGKNNQTQHRRLTNLIIVAVANIRFHHVKNKKIGIYLLVLCTFIIAGCATGQLNFYPLWGIQVKCRKKMSSR